MDLRTLLRAASFLVLLAVAAPAQAKPYRFPGRWQIGVAPLGFQVLQSRGSTLPAYRAAADIAWKYGKIAKGYQLWIGLAGGWSPVQQIAGSLVQDVRVDLFAHLSVPTSILEAPGIGIRGLKKQPIVPYVRFGVSGDMQFADNPISKSIGLRLGGGITYFFSDHVGLDANAGAAVGLGTTASGSLGLTTGSVDVMGGLRFAPGHQTSTKKGGGGGGPRRR